MTAAAAAAIAALVVISYWRKSRRKDDQRFSLPSFCLSDMEEKPQNRFKRVLVDNSYKAFVHLKREEVSGGDLFPSSFFHLISFKLILMVIGC